MSRLALALVTTLALAGCGGDDGVSPPGSLDPNVPPVTSGSWYRPVTATSWQWQLNGAINSSYDVDVYDIDLFDSDAALISSLKASGRMVICYFSAGSSEDWRPDFDDFADTDMGEPLGDWEGENWLDIRSANVQRIMEARLDLAGSKGCNGVEPDNVDGFTNDSGFDLTEIDQLAFNRFLANEAHQRNLTVGLKNDGDQAQDLFEYFDFSLNEQCHELAECDQLAVFTNAGKPILNAEYADSEPDATTLAISVCPQALAEDIRALILPMDLDDSFRVSCD